MNLDLPPIDLMSVGSIVLYVVAGFLLCALYVARKNRIAQKKEKEKKNFENRYRDQIVNLGNKLEMAEAELAHLKSKGYVEAATPYSIPQGPTGGMAWTLGTTGSPVSNPINIRPKKKVKIKIKKKSGKDCACLSAIRANFGCVCERPI